MANATLPLHYRVRETPASSQKIYIPNNITAFFHLLIHLQKVGFPGHWLADFLQSIVSDQLTTNVAPYTGHLPIPMRHDWTESRKPTRVHLAPWQADIEAIVTRIVQALPFAIQLPANFATPQDIGLFRAAVNASTYTHLLSVKDYPLGNPFGASAVGLLFYDPQKCRDRNNLAANVAALLQGKGPSKDGEVSIVLSVEHADVPSGEIRWRMSRDRVRRMKEDKWIFVVLRTDIGIAGK